MAGKVHPLNLDPILGTAKNRVARVGVELEGGFNPIPPGISMATDASVFKGLRDNYPGYSFGEIPIGPLQPAALPRFMKKFYPKLVDASCGMHIHQSFENLMEYQWLEVPEYQETVIEYLSRWAAKEGFPASHHIWSRLAGKSVFCQKKFWPDDQVNHKGPKTYDQTSKGHRYTIVNYCGRYNTIEIRVLPMMETVEQAIRAVKFTIEVTNACLVKLGKKEEPIKGRVQLASGETYEEVFEEELPLTAPQRKRVSEW